MKPTSSLVMPIAPNTSATTGWSISTSLCSASRRTRSDWAKDTTIVRDRNGYLVTGADLSDFPEFDKCWPLARRPYFLETSVPGSFAAGDVRYGSVKRVASAAGEGAMAVTFVHRYLAEAAA